MLNEVMSSEVKLDQVSSGQFLSGLFSTDQVRSGQFRSGQDGSRKVRSAQVRQDTVRLCQVLPGWVRSGHVK